MHNNEMKFLKTHEWTKLENDTTAYVGISNHAQELLGDIVYLELPKVGQSIKMNDTIGVVESVKAASDLYSPISGEVIAINTDAVNNPSLVNSNPEDKGWLMKVKPNNVNEFNQLLNKDDYKKIIES